MTITIGVFWPGLFNAPSEYIFLIIQLGKSSLEVSRTNSNVMMTINQEEYKTYIWFLISLHQNAVPFDDTRETC